MYERSKDESEKIKKYSDLMVGFIAAALIVFVAPYLIEFITGDFLDADGNIKTPASIPEALEERVSDIIEVALWAVRILMILGVLVTVSLLHVAPEKRP